MNRRDILSKALKTAAGTIALSASGIAAANDLCSPLTPTQPEGPFYPKTKPVDRDANLVQLNGHHLEAQGTKILIVGRIVGLSNDPFPICEPIEGVLVDLWQACHTGRYNHPSDPNTAPLDPNFQYCAEIKTDKDGIFRLRTIIPGAYQASPNWLRPPHIHLRIEKRGFKELTTQLYFDQFAELNQKDLILQELDSIEQSSLVMTQKIASQEDQDLGEVQYRYDTEIILQRPRLRSK